MLEHYQLLVNVGHFEYVSKEMHDQVVDFVMQGGNAAFFAGNECWWRVRIDDDGNAMWCYKIANFDPVQNPDTLTVNWSDDDAMQMTGVAYKGGGADFAADDDAGRAATQYVVNDENHWVFAGTDLLNGDRFGVYDDGQATVIGNETDINITGIVPPVDGNGPTAFTTLAQSNDAEGSPLATMGIFTRGGTVFAASTIDWTLGLSQDDGWTVLDQITLNVLDRLSHANPGWFAVPGAELFDHQSQHVAAVSRAPGNLDLFVIGSDDHVWTTYWNDQAGWSDGWFAVPGAELFDHQSQHVAAVSRAPGNLDLFVIGSDDHVWTTYWNDQAGWSDGWFAVPGAELFDHQSQHVAAVSRAPGNLDLFVIGSDDHVWTTYWNDQAGWSDGWFAVPGAELFDHQSQHVAAVSRAPGNLDLFVIGSDDHVWTTYWNDQAGWSDGWFAVPGAELFDHQSQHVAAVSRAPGNLDLFVIGSDDHVWTTYWNDQAGWSDGWFAVPGAELFDHQSQHVAAVSRAPGNLDLFVIGFDDHVWTTYWNDQAGWNDGWFAVPGAELFDHQSQHVAAVSRAPGNLDLFVIGSDDHVWTTYWNDQAGWS